MTKIHTQKILRYARNALIRSSTEINVEIGGDRLI
jgi:hypothetical protein